MPRRASLALVSILFALPAGSAHAALLAGAASADITPPITSPMFAYTARSFVFGPDSDLVTDRGQQMVFDPDTGYYAKTFRASNGIHTRVLSRALVFQRGGERYAMVQADLGGLPYALTQEVTKRIADTGITPDHLLLSATHTHSSTGAIWPADNSGYAFVGGDAFDPRIFELTAAGISKAIHDAVAHLEPARVGLGAIEHRGASRNRSYDAFLLDKDIPTDPDQQRLASTDPTFTVLRVDAKDGRPIAAWSNFAVHPTSFGDNNHLFSGDGAGVAARLAELGMKQAWAEDGGRDRNAPPPVDVWTNGAQGDISPDGDATGSGDSQVEWVNTDAAKADLAGERDAAGILAAWRAAGENMSARLPIEAKRELISFDGSSYGPDGGMQEPVGPFPILGLGVVDENQCAPVENAAGPGQGPKAPLYGGPGATPDTFPVSVWRIGGLGIAAFPAEITKQMGQRIRTDLLDRAQGRLGRFVIAGLTNGYISYTTTPEEYNSCDYEASFTLYGREEGYAWMAFGRQLEGALLDGRPVSSRAEPVPLGAGTTQSTPVRPTSDAGTVTAQPAANTGRYGRAVFKWRGGDQQIDPAPGRWFVALQRDDGGGGWSTVGTEDSPADTTQRANGEWTETWQFDRCSPTGRYRFVVQGVAVRNPGDAPSTYTAQSDPFEVGRVTLSAGTPVVSDGVATVRPLYPDPGAGALLALPRLLRDGQVTLHLDNGSTVTATGDGNGNYSAPVGDAHLTGVDVRDPCGNTN